MKMNKLLSALLVLTMALSICACSLAEGSTITLAELKAQTPERLQMTVTTDAGETVTVDAPVILPDGDSMPIVLCQRMTFNMADVLELYPVAKNSTTYQTFVDPHWMFNGSPLLNVVQENQKNALFGKTDAYKHFILPQGASLPENDFTVEQAMAILYRCIEQLGGDASVDLRPVAHPMGGLYHMKRAKVTDGNGVSWTEIVPDEKKPVEGRGKGLWQIQLNQYAQNARIFSSYLPDGMFQPTDWARWSFPIQTELLMMDDENFRIFLTCLKEKENLVADAPLLSFSEMERTIRERFASGKLKSVYQLELGYSVQIVAADLTKESEESWLPSTRYVLVPEWQILGFDEKDARTAQSVGLKQPSREMILDPLRNGGVAGRFELRLNAETGKPILASAAMSFDLEESAQ